MAYKERPWSDERTARHRARWAKSNLLSRARDEVLKNAGLTYRDKAQSKSLGAVSGAVHAGLLPRLSGNIKCSDCDNPASEYDHRSYARPLDVQPVCRRCNGRRGPAEDSMAKVRQELYAKAGLACIKSFHVTPEQIEAEINR